MRRDRPSEVRRLGLGDLIIAAAACAVLVVIVKEAVARYLKDIPWYRWASYLGEYAPLRFWDWLGAHGLTVASATLLVIRLRSPRPSRRRLWRQPGLAASVGAMAGLLVGVMGLMARVVGDGGSLTLTPAIVPYLDAARPGGSAGVLGAWLALGLAGRWQAERGAIDRLGRVVGVLWLVEGLMAELPTSKWVLVVQRVAHTLGGGG